MAEGCIKERVTFSDLVSQPILSCGRLLRPGGQLMVVPNASSTTRLSVQNQSLVVRAQIRMIQEPGAIRALRVRLNPQTTRDGSGWGFMQVAATRLHSSRWSSGTRVMAFAGRLWWSAVVVEKWWRWLSP